MTKTEFDILMHKAEVASKIQYDIQNYKTALAWLKCSALYFRLGENSFSEVPPGLSLPAETWNKLREEITSAIQSRIEELQQQFKEL